MWINTSVRQIFHIIFVQYFNSTEYMEAKFSPRVKDLMAHSRKEAFRLRNESVSAEHLLLGLIKLNEGTAVNIVQEFQLDLKQIKTEIDVLLGKSSVAQI